MSKLSNFLRSLIQSSSEEDSDDSATSNCNYSSSAPISDSDDSSLCRKLDSSSSEADDTLDFFSYYSSSRSLDDSLFKPIHSGCDLELMDVVFQLTSIYKKHNLTKSTMTELLEHITNLMPQARNFPDNKYHYDKLINNLSYDPVRNPSPANSDYFCASCLHSYGKNDCKSCPRCKFSGSAVCVQLDVKRILCHMLQSRGLAQLLESQSQEDNKNKYDGIIRDISHGSVSRRVKKESVYDLKLIHNTSQFPFAKGNSKQVWPTFLAITDIAADQRPKYLILASVWFSPLKADMHKFANIFTEQMRQLHTEGVKWQHPVSHKQLVSKVSVIASTLDGPARASALQMNFTSCTFCEIKHDEVATKDGKKTALVYRSPEEGSVRRTQEKIVLQAQLKEMGFRGVSPLAALPNFDLVESSSPDYLDSCLLGVVKQWTRLIVDPKNRDEDFYVGKELAKINEKMDSLKVPSSFVARVPRNLSKLPLWNGVEFRNWLFYYSLPCLHKVLKEKYFSHHCLLVESIYILCKAEISLYDLQHAKDLLEKYSFQFGKLYGEAEMSLNVHLLLHLTRAVQRLGPLWAHSTFMFAKVNEQMMGSIHGNVNVANEMAKTWRIHYAIETMQYMKDQRERKNNTASTHDDGIRLLGAEVSRRQLNCPATSNAIFQTAGSLTQIKLFPRCKINEISYTSVHDLRETKTCSHFVAFVGNSGEVKYAKVVVFVAVGLKKYFAGKLVRDLGAAYATKKGDEVAHIKKCVATEIVVIKEAKSIQGPVFFMGNVLAEPPNLHELKL